MCDIANHFIDNHAETRKEEYEENKLCSIIGISQLKNPPSNKEAKLKRIKEFVGYWRMKVGTIKLYGLNGIKSSKNVINRFVQSSKIVIIILFLYWSDLCALAHQAPYIPTVWWDVCCA